MSPAAVGTAAAVALVEGPPLCATRGNNVASSYSCVGRVILLGREPDRGSAGSAAAVSLVEGARHVLSTGDTVRFHCE